MVDSSTTPLWRSDGPGEGHPPIPTDAAAEVCVVGAGISGLTTAYLLAREGKDVLVLDAGGFVAGETARTTAHLVNVLDRRYAEIEKLRGIDALRLAIESHALAIDEIEAIAGREQIDCDFARVPGYLVAADDPSVLAEELDAARRGGFQDAVPVADFVFGGLHAPAIRFPRQATFHPLRYLAGLAEAAEGANARIHGATAVRSMERVEGRWKLETASGRTIHATHVVLATNSPIHGAISIHTKQAAYRTYVVAARIEPGELPNVLVWDTLDPFHYVRTARTADGEMLIVGGEDHKTGQDEHAADRFARLERWASARWPSLRWTVRWSGQVMETVDGLAMIGADPSEENLWIATGDSGNGMTHGTLAGLVLRDAILGRTSPFASLYEPSRFPLRAATRWASENLNVAAQLPRYLAPGEDPTEEGPPCGTGTVVRRGIRPIAAYRDDAGVLHERSAICPHLGCVVAWNEVESSWDCPCHGSRFDPVGRVIAGPASRDLAPVEDPDSSETRAVPVIEPKVTP